MKKAPQRTCIGCLAKKSKEKLTRLVIKNDQVMIDPSAKAHGRGAYLCKTRKGIKKACFKKAIKGGAFKRTFKKDLNVESLLKNCDQKKEKNISQKRKTSLSTSSGRRLRPC